MFCGWQLTVVTVLWYLISFASCYTNYTLEDIIQYQFYSLCEILNKHLDNLNSLIYLVRITISVCVILTILTCLIWFTHITPCYVTYTCHGSHMKIIIIFMMHMVTRNFPKLNSARHSKDGWIPAKTFLSCFKVL